MQPHKETSLSNIRLHLGARSCYHIVYVSYRGDAVTVMVVNWVNTASISGLGVRELAIKGAPACEAVPEVEGGGSGQAAEKKFGEAQILCIFSPISA